LEDLSLLGNAAAVPIIIFLTQVLKKNFSFPYKSDFLALVLALVVCTGWEIYNITPETLQELSTGFLAGFRFVVDTLITSFATWLAASKVYDLGHGNKKKAIKVAEEKRVLEEEIKKWKNENGASDTKVSEKPEVSDKLREILEAQ
jgi:hypothetical protein